MLAGGIPEPSEDHALSVVEMALDMLNILPKINRRTQNEIQIRIGINSGPVSAGVIGKKKFIYKWFYYISTLIRRNAVIIH